MGSELTSELDVRLIRALTETLSATLDFTYAWRNAELDSGADIDFDEEGAFSGLVAAAGFIWRWEAD